MTGKVQRHEITLKRVVYELPGLDAVAIQHDVVYRTTDAAVLTLDIYRPPMGAPLPPPTGPEAGTFRRAEPQAIGARVPAVVIVAGFPDAGFEAFVGCKFKDAEFNISWAQLIAASGLVAITYTNREPAADLRALLQHVRRHAASLGVDESRIGVWAASGHVPLALSLLMQDDRDFLRCAVLCYGFTLDVEGSTAVAEAASQWTFANPGAGKSVADLPRDLPLFVARAGRDAFPGLNETLDRFLAGALACNLPITVVNHHTGPHAFDVLDDSAASREIIGRILAFLRFHLLG